MAAEEERQVLKSIDRGNDEWSKKVDQMSDEKVIELFITIKRTDAKEEA